MAKGTIRAGQIVYTRKEMDWVQVLDRRRANVITALGILGQSGGPRQGKRNAQAGLWDASVIEEIVNEIDAEWRRVRALLLEGNEAAETIYTRGHDRGANHP